MPWVSPPVKKELFEYMTRDMLVGPGLGGAGPSVSLSAEGDPTGGPRVGPPPLAPPRGTRTGGFGGSSSASLPSGPVKGRGPFSRRLPEDPVDRQRVMEGLRSRQRVMDGLRSRDHAGGSGARGDPGHGGIVAEELKNTPPSWTRAGGGSTRERGGARSSEDGIPRRGRDSPVVVRNKRRAVRGSAGVRGSSAPQRRAGVGPDGAWARGSVRGGRGWGTPQARAEDHVVWTSLDEARRSAKYNSSSKETTDEGAVHGYGSDPSSAVVHHHVGEDFAQEDFTHDGDLDGVEDCSICALASPAEESPEEAGAPTRWTGTASDPLPRNFVGRQSGPRDHSQEPLPGSSSSAYTFERYETTGAVVNPTWTFETGASSSAWTFDKGVADAVNPEDADELLRNVGTVASAPKGSSSRGRTIIESRKRSQGAPQSPGTPSGLNLREFLQRRAPAKGSSSPKDPGPRRGQRGRPEVGGAPFAPVEAPPPPFFPGTGGRDAGAHPPLILLPGTPDAARRDPSPNTASGDHQDHARVRAEDPGDSAAALADALLDAGGSPSAKLVRLWQWRAGAAEEKEKRTQTEFTRALDLCATHIRQSRKKMEVLEKRSVFLGWAREVAGLKRDSSVAAGTNGAPAESIPPPLVQSAPAPALNHDESNTIQHETNIPTSTTSTRTTQQAEKMDRAAAGQGQQHQHGDFLESSAQRFAERQIELQKQAANEPDQEKVDAKMAELKAEMLELFLQREEELVVVLKKKFRSALVDRAERFFGGGGGGGSRERSSRGSRSRERSRSSSSVGISEADVVSAPSHTTRTTSRTRSRIGRREEQRTVALIVTAWRLQTERSAVGGGSSPSGSPSAGSRRVLRQANNKTPERGGIHIGPGAQAFLCGPPSTRRSSGTLSDQQSVKKAARDGTRAAPRSSIVSSDPAPAVNMKRLEMSLRRVAACSKSGFLCTIFYVFYEPPLNDHFGVFLLGGRDIYHVGDTAGQTGADRATVGGQGL